MGALSLGVALPVLAAIAPAALDPVERWRPEIAEASLRFGVPEAWIERVIRAESGGRTRLAGRPIRSPKGAIGLMQLMPGTWAEIRVRLGLGEDPDNPRDNILAGSFYLRAMYDRFGYPGLFGAYNAGPARYSAWLAGRAHLPGETAAYLARVGGAAVPPRGEIALAPPPLLPSSPPLFVVQRATGARDPRGDARVAVDPRRGAPPPVAGPQATLFAIRRGGE